MSEPKKILVDIDVLERFIESYEGDKNTVIYDDTCSELRQRIQEARNAK